MEKSKAIEEFEEIRILSREDLLKILSELTIKIKNKIFYGRFNKPQLENLRIKYDRLFCDVIKTYNAVLKDKEISELEERIRKLEEALNYDEGR